MSTTTIKQLIQLKYKGIRYAINMATMILEVLCANAYKGILTVHGELILMDNMDLWTANATLPDHKLHIIAQERRPCGFMDNYSGSDFRV